MKFDNSPKRMLVVVSLVVLFPQIVMAQPSAEAPVRLLDHWSTAFGGTETEFRVSAARSGVVLHCRHSSADRTISRYEAGVDTDGVARFALRLPPVRDGVVIKTELTFSLTGADRDSGAAGVTHPLWLFPLNPLPGQRQAFEELHIRLFDPEQKTAEALDQIDFPYHSIQSLNGLEPADGSIVVIGEGISLKRRPALMEQVFALAARGVNVVVLAPSDGAFDVPGLTSRGDGEPERLELRRDSVIRDFDKRFDSKQWVGAGPAIPAAGLKFESPPGRIHAVVSTEVGEWRWLRLQSATSRGTVVFCGFQVVRHWQSGPTPRFLLVELLKSLDHSSHAEAD